MKKRFNILLLILLIMMVVFLPSCKENEEDAKTDKTITIFTVNDFHGAIKDKAAKVANYVEQKSISVPDFALFQFSYVLW